MKTIDYDTFKTELKKMYFEERKRQEFKGVVAIKSKNLIEKFAEQYPNVSKKQLEKHFEKLKEKDIFTANEMGKKLMA